MDKITLLLVMLYAMVAIAAVMAHRNGRRMR
jgi:hypothetical protein